MKMSEYCYCGKCGSEMKPKGLARMEGLCQYCWDKWYRQELVWLGRVFKWEQTPLPIEERWLE